MSGSRAQPRAARSAGRGPPRRRVPRCRDRGTDAGGLRGAARASAARRRRRRVPQGHRCGRDRHGSLQPRGLHVPAPAPGARVVGGASAAGSAPVGARWGCGVSGLDRRALGVLGVGHLSADFCQGALPALLPFLAAERGWSYGALGALMLASSVGSSIVQPLFGLASDRIARPWFMPLGVLTAGLGLAAVGLMSSYPLTALAVAVGGLGVAAFHPEAARYANLASGARRGRGMSLFSLGGNAGFALGPALATPLVLAFGLTGTLGLALLPAGAAVLTALNLNELRSTGSRDGVDQAGPPPRDRNAWGPFARLAGVVGLRSALYFGLQTLVPE